MRNYKILVSFLILAGIMFSGFQCTSTELTSAKLYIQQKNYDKALEVLQKEVAKNPQSAEGFYWMAVVYQQKEQPVEMVDAAQKSLAISDEFKTQLNDLLLSEWAKTFNQGAAFYKRGFESEDEDSTRIYYQKSTKAFENAIIIMPDSLDAYRNLTLISMNTGNMEGAIKPLQNLIDRRQAAEGYNYLGEIYYRMGLGAEGEKAQEHFTKAIDVLSEGRTQYPDNQEILLTLSNSYIAANRIDEALETFKAGVEQDPENQYYRYNYGVLLLGGDNYEAAEKQFLKAIEIDPDYANALYNLGVNYVKWGTAINKAAEESGDMSTTEYRTKYEMALPHLERVVELRPEDSATWELLGRVYTVLGMDEKAADAFNKSDQFR